MISIFCQQIFDLVRQEIHRISDEPFYILILERTANFLISIFQLAAVNLANFTFRIIYTCQKMYSSHFRINSITFSLSIEINVSSMSVNIRLTLILDWVGSRERDSCAIIENINRYLMACWPSAQFVIRSPITEYSKK